MGTVGEDVRTSVAKARDAAYDTAPIVLGLFAALVGTDPFNARGRSHVLTLVNELALAFWVATILLLVSAHMYPGRRRRLTGVATFVSFIVALLLTITMFVMLPTRYGSDSDEVQVMLATPNRVALDKLCGTGGKAIVGRIATGSLENAFIVLHLDRDHDADTDTDGTPSAQCDDVRIPVASIQALREVH
jgi:hypothetical protein